VPKPRAIDPAAIAPGPAYLAVEGVGLARLVDGALTQVADVSSTAALSFGANGVVYAETVQGILRVDRDKTTTIAAHRPYATYTALVAGRGGALFATDHDSLFRYDGHAWQIDPGSTFQGASISDHLLVDRDGNAWVLAHRIYKRDGQSWVSVDVPGNPVINSFALGPLGELYLGLSDHRLQYQLAGASHELGELDAGVSEIVVGPTGAIAASGLGSQVMIGTPGAAPRVIDLTSIGAKLTHARAFAVDGSGRSWFSSDNGIVIVDAAGKLLQQWAPGTVAGLNGKVTALAILGAGPALPTLTAAKRGTVVGKVLTGGKPAANAAVELCEQPQTMFKSSPCETASYVGTAMTTTDGSFRIANVPSDSYAVMVSTDKWHHLLGVGCCTSVRPEADTDLGELTIR